jgi:hypothetical protein
VLFANEVLWGGAEKSSQKSQNTSLSNGVSHAELSSPGSQTDSCMEDIKGLSHSCSS